MSLRLLPLLAAAAALSAGCSKFGRLEKRNDGFTSVRIGSSRHRSQLASQAGGVMVWGFSAAGDRFAVALNDETSSKPLSLKNGDWTFFASGWTGTDRFEGTTRCGKLVRLLEGAPTDVDLEITTGHCNDDVFGTFSASGAHLPLRITTCRGTSFAGVTNGNSSACTGTPNIGPFRAFKISMNAYLPTTGSGTPAVTESLTTACKNNSGWSGGTAPFDIPSVLVPTGDGGNSPIDTTILAYTDPSCSTTPVELRFPHGISGGTSVSTQLYSGTSPSSVSLFLLGPAPTVSAVSPASGTWAGGTTVTLTGTGFFSGTTVTLNGRTCTSPSGSATSYTCVTPNSVKSGSATVVVNNLLQSTTLSSATPFSFTETPFGNGVDGDVAGSTVTYNTSSTNNWSNANSLGSRVASASANVTAITQNATTTDLTLGTAFTAADFDVDDEVLWHVSAASSTTACSTAGDLTVGKFGSGRVTIASSPTLRISGTISSTTVAANIAASTRTAGSTFCVIQVVRVPNFRNLVFDSSAALLQIDRSGFSYANGHGGILAFRVAGTLTYTGSNAAWLMLKGLGYPGGAGATLPFQGSGRLGTGLSSGAQLSNNDMGGAPALSVGGGGGAGYGDGGNGGAASPSGKGIGVTTCLPSAGCALFGGGGGGGNASGADGGAGGGIALVYATQISFSSFSGAAQPWTGGQEGGGSSTNAAGAGSGGTTFVQVRSASGVQLDVVNAGGHAAGGGPAVLGGGAGAGGLTETRECSGSGITTLNADVGTGNGGTGSSFNGSSAGAGNVVRNALASGVEFCP